MKFLIFFLMLPHLKPPSFAYLWPTVGAIFNAGRFVSVLVMIFLYLLKNKLPSKPVWVLAALQGWRLVVTFLRAQENIQDALVIVAPILAVALLIDFFSDRAKELLSGLMLNMEIMIYANLASILLYYPNGMYRNASSNYVCYFLGYHNSFILYVFPSIVIAFLYLSTTGKKLRPILVMIAGVLSIFITWSATSICGLLVFAATLLLCKTSAKEIITYPNIFAVTMAANLLISVFRIMDRVLWVTIFVESFLKKQITLTGRIYVWDSFYHYFSRSPWLGYGVNMRIRSSIGTAYHTHNTWFQCLFEGGLPALLIFLIFNFLVGKQIRKHAQKISSTFLSVFAALYVIYIAETYLDSPWLYMLYILAYHAGKFEAVSVPAVRRVRLVIKRGHHVPNRKFPEKY